MYSKEDEDFLRNNYSTLGQKGCAENLNRSMKSVSAKARRLGLLAYPPCAEENNKRCGRCKTEQPKDSFNKSKNRKDGLHPICKNCGKIARGTDAHKKHKRKYDYKYVTQRLKADIVFKLKHRLRRRIRACVTQKRNRATFNELLGCTAEECYEHLESLFKEGMTWDNYGLKGWHIDHIIPCASFNLLDLGEQKKCFNYKNLQPLWWWENLSKGDKIL